MTNTNLDPRLLALFDEIEGVSKADFNGFIQKCCFCDRPGWRDQSSGQGYCKQHAKWHHRDPSKRQIKWWRTHVKGGADFLAGKTIVVHRNVNASIALSGDGKHIELSSWASMELAKANGDAS